MTVDHRRLEYVRAQRVRRLWERLGADVCIAFPGGPGTRNCVSCCVHTGLRVVQAFDSG